MLKDISFRMKVVLYFLIGVLCFSCSSPPTNYIILCAGDSLTEAGYPPFLGRILKTEGIRAKIVNQGKSGYSSKEYLAFLQKNKTAITDSHPDYICLQLGTNDVRIDYDHTSAEEFYANLKKIIRIFQESRTRSGKTPRILIATIPPIPDDTPFPFSPQSAKRITQEINPLIKKLAQEEKLSLVDNFSVFLDNPHLLPEVHPSVQGYEALAHNWLLGLKKQGVRSTSKT